MGDAGDRQLRAIAPFFLVADVVRPAAWCCDGLGFTVEPLWGGDPPCFAVPHRDGMTVMLSQAKDKARIQPNGGEDGKSWDAYVWVRDADLLFAGFNAKGVDVVYPPVDRDCNGNREFAVRDPDGYVIAFAHGIAAKAQAG
jgi:hypothetical protein